MFTLILSILGRILTFFKSFFVAQVKAEVTTLKDDAAKAVETEIEKL